MATYTNLTDVNVSTSIVVPTLTSTTSALTVANITTANFALAATLAAPPALTATNTNANFAALNNCVANIVQLLKGIALS